MDRQSMQLGGGGDSGAATQEWLYPGSGGGGQVIDGTFLMELLEEAPATEQKQEDIDQLSRVIQSLEAEIGGIRSPPASSAPANGGSNKTADHVSGDVDDGLLDDMLSDLDSPCVADEAMPPFEYWAEVSPAVVGHDMGGWYLDGDGVMVGGNNYEFREQCYYGYGESLVVDQVYSPLWE